MAVVSSSIEHAKRSIWLTIQRLGWRFWAAAGVTIVVVVAIAAGVASSNGASATAPIRTAIANAWSQNPEITCQGTNWTISGTVRFQQAQDSSKVNIFVDLHGLPPGQHGFHVHNGSSTGFCNAGGHFNPFSRVHGGPADEVRHVGDLGNIQADGSGVASVSFTDSGISLWDPARRIDDRPLMIHCGQDDLGQGSSIPPLSSNRTGNAGNMTACATITLQ